MLSSLIGAILLCSPVMAEVSLQDQVEKIPFKHKWIREKCESEVCIFNSKFHPPTLFGAKTEAVLIVSQHRRDKAKDLDEALNRDLKDISSHGIIVDYLEQDGRKLKDKIAVYKEKIGGSQVGFLKYRTLGFKENPQTSPYTRIDSVFLRKTTEISTHLLVFYAGHQDEVREDQLLLISEMAKIKD